MGLIEPRLQLVIVKCGLVGGMFCQVFLGGTGMARTRCHFSPRFLKLPNLRRFADHAGKFCDSLTGFGNGAGRLDFKRLADDLGMFSEFAGRFVAGTTLPKPVQPPITELGDIPFDRGTGHANDLAGFFGVVPQCNNQGTENFRRTNGSG